MICNVYDEHGSFCSLAGKCRFCGMIKLGKPKEEFLYEDEHLVIIKDMRPEAAAHY